MTIELDGAPSLCFNRAGLETHFSALSITSRERGLHGPGRGILPCADLQALSELLLKNEVAATGGSTG
jgi:hypothetical protein